MFLLKTVSTILSLILLLSPVSSIQARDKKSDFRLIFNKTVHLKQQESFVLKTNGGDVIIGTWTLPRIQLQVFGNLKAEKRFEFSVKEKSDEIVLKGKKRGNSFFNLFSNPRLRYEIKLPEEFNAKILTAGGDVKINSLSGEAYISTSGGDIYVSESNGSLETKTSGGDIQIVSFIGPIELATSGGDIISKDIIGNVNAKTSGGDINLSVTNGKVNARTSGGDIYLNYSGENKGIELYSSGGDISVRVPRNFSAYAELKTAGGEIYVNVKNNNPIKKSKYSLTTEINSNGLPLICKTVGGDIVVREK